MLSLFDIPPHQDTKTSREAAISVIGKTATMREIVLKCLQEAPKTDEQLTDATGLLPNTLRPRRVELCRLGLIEQVGTAKTRSGRSAVLWGAR